MPGGRTAPLALYFRATHRVEHFARRKVAAVPLVMECVFLGLLLACERVAANGDRFDNALLPELQGGSEPGMSVDDETVPCDDGLADIVAVDPHVVEHLPVGFFFDRMEASKRLAGFHLPRVRHFDLAEVHLFHADLLRETRSYGKNNAGKASRAGTFPPAEEVEPLLPGLPDIAPVSDRAIPVRSASPSLPGPGRPKEAAGTRRLASALVGAEQAGFTRLPGGKPENDLRPAARLLEAAEAARESRREDRVAPNIGPQ